jgi:hypothetical protein
LGVPSGGDLKGPKKVEEPTFLSNRVGKVETFEALTTPKTSQVLAPPRFGQILRKTADTRTCFPVEGRIQEKRPGSPLGCTK